MSNVVGTVAPSGNLSLTRMPRWPGEPSALEILRHAMPTRGLGKGVAAWRLRNLPNLWRGLWRVATARALGIPHHYGVLYLDVIHKDGSRTPLGLASMRVVTTAGAGYLVDALQNLVEAENMKFHGFGTGTTAEAAGDTALVTEETTQYATDNTRPTGSQTENGAQVYRTVGTYSPDSGGTRAITEHGIFSQAATGGGVLLDRSVFSAVNLVASADSLQATYDLTINSGG
jgi:hypothetical protein